MLKYIKINKIYKIFDKNIFVVDDDIFSKNLKALQNTYINNNNTEEIYMYYNEKRNFLDKRILMIFNDKFKINVQYIIPYNKNISLEDNSIIRIEDINKKSVIDNICYLSTVYKDVYLSNCILDNPFKNIFYIVCINKTEKIKTIDTTAKKYITNINDNKHNIYVYLYSCFYYSLLLYKNSNSKYNNIIDNYIKSSSFVNNFINNN